MTTYPNALYKVIVRDPKGPTLDSTFYIKATNESDAENEVLLLMAGKIGHMEALGLRYDAYARIS